MKHLNLQRITVAGLMAAAATAAQGVAVYTTDGDEPQPKQNEFVVTFGYPDLREQSGAAEVADSLRIEDRSLGGVERLYWENSADKDTRVYLEGRFLFHPEEFAIRYEAIKPEKFSLNIDFQHWIEYDNAAGVWYPPTDDFLFLSANALEEEINRLKIEFQLNAGEATKLKLGYELFSRSGQSLSTVFGDDYQYEIGRTVDRGIVPALVDGEETVQSVDLGIVREEDADRTGMRLSYREREVDRRHIVERAARQPAANRYTTQTEESQDDLFGASAFMRRQLSETIYGSVGVAYTRLDGDLTGSRVFGANPEAAYDIDFAATQLNDRGFLDLSSSRQLRQWVCNANLVLDPEGDFRWMTGVRLERLSTEAFGSYIDTVDQIDWPALARQDEEAAMWSASEKSAWDYSAFLEVRYTGIPKTTLFSRVEAATQSGDLKEGWTRQELVPDARGVVQLLDRATDFDRDTMFWEAGANYNPMAAMRVSLQGYIKLRDNSLGYGRVVLPEEEYMLYPGYIQEQQYETKDVNARLHWRIFQDLQSVSRVDLQNTTIESRDRVNPALDSAETERVMFNQSLVWTPHPRLFLSAAYTLVDDLTETPAADIDGTFGGIIVNLPGDYWQADFDAYYVISKLIDVQVGYHYLEMTNAIDNSPKTVVYGSDLEQHHASGGLVFHFTEPLTLRLGYHYYEQTDPASAGYRDYKVHLIKTDLQVKF